MKGCSVGKWLIQKEIALNLYGNEMHKAQQSPHNTHFGNCSRSFSKHAMLYFSFAYPRVLQQDVFKSDQLKQQF